jgi:predicted DNA-binding transcriptional regulator AlpA
VNESVVKEPEPALISAKRAAAFCGVSTSSWYRCLSAGKVPAPVKLNGRTLWRLLELRDWIAAGCPSRQRWEHVRAAAG